MAAITANDIDFEAEYAGRQFPWEVLGTDISDIPLTNVGAVLAAAGLDWTVSEHTPHDFVNGEWMPQPNAKSLRRGDTFDHLGSHSDKYQIVQNSALVDLAAAVKEVDPTFNVKAGGELDNGKIVWIQAVGAPRTDGLSSNLTLFKSHDGSAPLMGSPWMGRMFCRNQLPAIRRAGTLVKVRHTRNVEDRLKIAAKVLQDTYRIFDEMDAEIQKLIETEITRRQFDELVAGILNPKGFDEGAGFTQFERRRDIVAASYEYNTDIAGSAWGFVNAINDLEANFSSIRSDRTVAERQMGMIQAGMPLTARARDLVLA